MIIALNKLEDLAYEGWSFHKSEIQLKRYV